MGTNRVEDALRTVGAQPEDRLALVGRDQRVDAEELTDRAYFFAERDRSFVDHDADAALFGHLVERARETAPSGVFECDYTLSSDVQRATD
jgi:hypothetical protein